MRKLIICLYVIYIIIISYLSLTPVEHKISLGIWSWDKAAHFTAYLLLAILVKRVHLEFSYLICVVTCTSYSFAIECIQYFIPNRMFDIFDILANLLGAILGAFLYYLIIERCFGSWKGVTVKDY
jgi:VanZ family protein